MRIRGHDIGVCSWSLQPTDVSDLIAKVKQLGLEHLQLGLTQLNDFSALKNSNLKLTATSITFPGEDYTSIAAILRTGGFVPDEPWPQRRDLAISAGKLTAEFGAGALEFHAGFIPSSNDPFYETLVDRVREVAVALQKDGVDLLLETGQESASEMLQFLNDLNCRNVAVNFDPANMILYGAGDPIEAIRILNRHIRHVHVKDAVASDQPRLQWGREVVFGTGEVGAEEFLDALDEIEYTGVLAIEREAGDDRLADIRTAIQVLQDTE